MARATAEGGVVGITFGICSRVGSICAFCPSSWRGRSSDDMRFVYLFVRLFVFLLVFLHFLMG